jgi:hypothetical protein
MKLNLKEIGIGATEELSLRVSVASLIRVLIDKHNNGKKLLVLERTATLYEREKKSEVVVKAKPFGGGVRLLKPQELVRLIGHFNYDSERSRTEKDFRIFVHPESWDKIKKIFVNNPNEIENGILDTSPDRELAEEFEDCLQVRITPDQYSQRLSKIILEDIPEKTESVRAYGFPTVRIYYLYKVLLKDPEIIRIITANSKQYTDDDLLKLALEDARQGGKGRANASLVLEFDELKKFYRSIPKNKYITKIRFAEHQLDGNVYAILT